MKNQLLISAIFIVIINFSMVSCKSSDKMVPVTEEETSVVIQETGVELWSDNCVRCHNVAPPNAYSDNEWEAIVNHMQKVGGLTVSDADKIAEFLKSSN